MGGFDKGFEASSFGSNMESGIDIGESKIDTGEIKIDTGESAIDTSENSEEIGFVPVHDGRWEGEKGDSMWIPDDEKVPEKANPGEKNWGEIKDDYGIEGIRFEGGEPDFSEVSEGEVQVDNFTPDRDKNFRNADAIEAEKRGWTREEMKDWRKENRYTWHEKSDCETMQLVPSIVHNNVFHKGGISRMKQADSMEGFLNE